jgi:hypothetical protein
MTIIQGVIHGKTIELDQEPGLPDGQQVEVTVMPLRKGQSARLPPGEGLRRAFGAWSDDTAGVDEFLEWNRRQRAIDRREIEG